MKTMVSMEDITYTYKSRLYQANGTKTKCPQIMRTTIPSKL